VSQCFLLADYYKLATRSSLQRR